MENLKHRLNSRREMSRLTSNKEIASIPGTVPLPLEILLVMAHIHGLLGLEGSLEEEEAVVEDRDWVFWKNTLIFLQKTL